MPFELQIVCELELMYSYLLYTRAMDMAQTTMESTHRVPPRVEKDRANLAKDHLESQVRVHLANLEKVRRSPERDLPSPAKAVAPMTLTATDTLRTVTAKTMDMATLMVDQTTFRADLMTQL